jgi:hypothetical protein
MDLLKKLAATCATAMAASTPSAMAPLPALPGAAEIRCPATLSQLPLADSVPAGWIVRSAPGELELQRAAFYEGDPVGMGSLVPDSTHRAGSMETSTYTFASDDSTRFWIGCLYRDVTAVVTRQLPAGLRQCTTRTRLSRMGDPVALLSVRCD